MFFSTISLKRINLLAIILFAVFLSACGGGGSSSNQSSTGGGGSGGSGGSGGGSTAIVSPMGCGTVTSTGSGNTTPIVIDGFPCAVAGTVGVANDPQEPYISVKICAPGSTTNCQIIDHVILDSGSSGLRIASSALNSSLQPGAGLPPFAGTARGTTMTECEQYVDSFVYGPMVNVDVYIAGEVVKKTPIQVFGVANYGVPTSCSTSPATGDTNTETNSVATFNGNGLLGVSFSTSDMGLFYDCTSSAANSCNQNFYAGMPGIVNQFATDNNGVAITLPAISATGSNVPVQGTLTFGISTQANNTPPAGTIALVNDGNPGDISTTFGSFNVQAGSTWYPAYIDSGTTTAFFPASANSALIACASSSNFAGWFCPTSTVNVPLAYANYGSQVTSATVTLSVANPTYLTGNTIAFNNVAGPTSASNSLNSEIALGLTTFFGYTNYFLFANMTAPGTNLGGSSSTTVPGPINGIYQTP